jgi:hypothetical protein
MFTAEYAENAEIFHEIRLGALCALGGETRYHLLLDHYQRFFKAARYLAPVGLMVMLLFSVTYTMRKRIISVTFLVSQCEPLTSPHGLWYIISG